MELEPITGVWGQTPQRGPGAEPDTPPGAEPLVGCQGAKPSPKLEGFGKTTSKSVDKFSTFTTYMQGLVSYFADNKQV